MSESNRADIHQSLLNDESDVKTKVGHVAKFDSDENAHDLEKNPIEIEDDLDIGKKGNQQFIGLTKEELKSYINDPKWKRIRWIIGLIYILIIIGLLVGSILLIISSPRCPPKPKLVWYQKEIVYDIDVQYFYDSNQDAIGDIQGVQQKLNYFEKNSIKSILLRSSIFDRTKNDLLTTDSTIANQTQFDHLIKSFNRKNMHIIIDLPLSTTFDRNGNSWYGSNQLINNKNPCDDQSSIGCQYYQSYDLFPLDFNNKIVSKQAESRIVHWLEKKRVDGIRVNLPLEFNSRLNSYTISNRTIQNWIKLVEEIEKKSKPKLFLIDVPFSFAHRLSNDDLNVKIINPLLLSSNNQIINSELLDQRIKSFHGNKSFWQFGSKRRSDSNGIIQDNILSKQMILTLNMLIGGTPIILYGQEIGQNQITNPLMSWTRNPFNGGFTNCSTVECQRILSSFQINPSEINVQREEALGDDSKDSLLKLFRRLSVLRLKESFQYGLLKSGHEKQSNVFWFIREASGHPGYIIIFNLNSSKVHLSLNELTNGNVPSSLHYEYQWPKSILSSYKEKHFNSDSLIIEPQSINIFFWKEKLLKPNILSENIRED